MKSLQDMVVLLVASPSTEIDTLSVWIASEGASLRTAGWDDALAQARALSPSVMLVDLRSEPAERALLDELRADAALAKQRAVALVSRGAPRPESPRGASYNKYVSLPAHPNDVVSALASLAADAAPAAEPAQELSLTALLTERARRGDMRATLALVNATGPFRFTSILRFDEADQLTSVWTFDRENREADSFPLDATAPSSYCARIRDTRAPFAMPDASLEPSVANHPARHTVLSYCGVPLLLGEEGTFFGTLCHFDLAPRMVGDSTVQRLEEAAAILKLHAPALSLDRPSTVVAAP